MGTTSQKLTYLNETKGKIKDGINSIGGELTTEPFREYVEELEEIYENLPKVNGEGESLSLSPTNKGRMKIELKGNTYQNGTPTPESPQDIQVVSGDNTIKVEGKQLFDKSKYQNLISNYEYTAGSYKCKKILLNPNTNYTISHNALSANNNVVLLLNNVQHVNASGYYDCRPRTNSKSFTTDNTGYLYIGVFYGISDNDYNTRLNEINLQIEEGTQATTYTPYVSQTYPISLGNIELCKIGTYQDSIVKDNGKWYLNKQIGKVVLNGSENWSYDTSGVTGIISSSIQISDMLSGNYLDGLTTYFHNDKSGKAKNSIRFGANNKYIYLYLDETEYTSANDVKAFLSTHNTEVYYVLATPTYEEITGELLTQLNALGNANSYNNQTNINQDNNDLASILNVSALLDANTYIDHLEAQVEALS